VNETRFGVLETSRSFRCRACGKAGDKDEIRLYDNLTKVVVCEFCAIKQGHKSEMSENIAVVLANHEARIKKLEEQIKELI